MSNTVSPNCSSTYHKTKDNIVTKIVTQNITKRATKTTPADWLRISLAVCLTLLLEVVLPGNGGNLFRTLRSMLWRSSHSCGWTFLTFFVISEIMELLDISVCKNNSCNYFVSIYLSSANEVWPKVMFLRLSVILFRGGGVSQYAMGRGVSASGFTGVYTHWADTPRQADTPLDTHTLGRHPMDTPATRQTPHPLPRDGHWSGWYASYCTGMHSCIL